MSACVGVCLCVHVSARAICMCVCNQMCACGLTASFTQVAGQALWCRLVLLSCALSILSFSCLQNIFFPRRPLSGVYHCQQSQSAKLNGIVAWESTIYLILN